MNLLPTLARLLPPERAHRLAIHALRLGLIPTAPETPELRVRAFGRELPNPIGLAAGFDKNAEAFVGALELGFGFVEVGTVTPKPQPGNPRPRVFRLTEDGALINRLGFNNAGLDVVRRRLEARDPSLGCVGANIGMNRGSEDPLADYAVCLRALHPLVDYLTVNVSSPNTPGLRELQALERLQALLSGLIEVREQCTDPAKRLLVKIAPDLTEAEEDDVAAAALASGVDGMIVSNTTVARPDGLRSRHRAETGGRSGRPLLGPSTAMLARMRKRVGDRLLLIGVGGVGSAADVVAKRAAGARLVQLYTALASDGFPLVGRIVRDLDAVDPATVRARVRDRLGES